MLSVHTYIHTILFCIVCIISNFFHACALLLDSSQAALRDVNLYIEPPAVRRSQSVTLRCHYKIEGAPLYSVKFYRGQLEFFRYTPGEYPNTKVFHFPGIKVDVSKIFVIDAKRNDYKTKICI